MVENRSIGTAKFSTIQNETDTQFPKRDRLQFKIYLTEHILEYHDN